MKINYPDFSILIVDDEPIALESFEFSLMSEGINNIILCGDSRQVPELIRNETIGLILLDLLMPGITGEELIPIIKEKRPDIPVIVITGYFCARFNK